MSQAKKSNDEHEKLVSELKVKFPEVFADGLGTCARYQTSITLKAGSTPVFKKARPVAYATLPAVVAEIERLEKAGILERTPHSDFAAPVVVVKKSDGSIRLCGDHSTGLNDAIERGQGNEDR